MTNNNLIKFYVKEISRTIRNLIVFYITNFIILKQKKANMIKIREIKQLKLKNYKVDKLL